MEENETHIDIETLSLILKKSINMFFFCKDKDLKN